LAAKSKSGDGEKKRLEEAQSIMNVPWKKWGLTCTAAGCPRGQESRSSAARSGRASSSGGGASRGRGGGRRWTENRRWW